MKSCQDYSEYFSPYLDKELPESQVKEFEAHLQGCLSCKENLNKMQEAWKMLDEYRPSSSFNPNYSSIRLFYSKTLPNSFFQISPQSFSLNYFKSIAAGFLCGIILYFGFEPTSTTIELENLSLWSNSDFEVIVNLDILENYEVFEYFSIEKLHTCKLKK